MALPLVLGAIGLGLGALKGIGDIFGGFSQASALQAKAREEARRMRLEHDRSISEATALGVASGITEDSNSLKAYVDSMTKEARREEDYTIQNGETAAGASKLAGMFGAAGDLGAGIFSFGAANNWFKTPTIK